jgi:hypothetical protein
LELIMTRPLESDFGATYSPRISYCEVVVVPIPEDSD